jgi:hypothetical protein
MSSFRRGVHQALEGWQVVSHIGEDGQIIDAGFGYRLHPGIDQAGHLKLRSCLLLASAPNATLPVEYCLSSLFYRQRTNTLYNTETVAHVYKALWTVEDIIRTSKSILETRPIYHKRDATIRGHVFCSFLALLLKQELESLMNGSRSAMGMERGHSRTGQLATGGS